MLAALRLLEDEATATLRRLVEVNSYTRNREGVLAVGGMCEELFAPLGFDARRVRSVQPDCGDHLFLTRGGGGPELMLVSHLDTVYPPDTDFPWREDGDRIYGPGTCDIKGGTVLIWMVLRALRDREPELFERVTWKLLLNASEEGGCADFPALARAEVTPATRACLVYEAGFDADDGLTTVAISRKGCGRFRLDVHGRAAHSGNAHEQGANAIRELARKVETIESWTDYGRGVTYSVGLIRGGTTVNSIPAHATCDVDLRAWTEEEFEEGRARVRALAGEGEVRSADGESVCRVEVSELPGYPPWPPNPESARLGELAAALGDGIVAARRKGGSDGCHLWDLAPTLDALGPVGRNAHRLDESVDRSSFVPRALLSIALIRKLT